MVGKTLILIAFHYYILIYMLQHTGTVPAAHKTPSGVQSYWPEIRN